MSKDKRKKLNKVKSILNRYLNKLEDNGFSVEEAFLFGSYARGDFREDSDIDIAVVSSDLIKNKEKYDKFLWHQVIDIDSRIEPIGYVPEDFNLSDPLVWEIKEEGVKIK